MRDRHKDRRVTWVYVCAECEEEFQDKKKVSAHVNRVHVGKAIRKDVKKGAFPCEYCEETFQSSRSRSMHVRNQHAAAQSARLAEESSLKTSVDSQPRHWDEETVRKFVRALFNVGIGSNVEIAREMKNKKTAHNVKGYKLRFLKDHPNWRTECRHLDPAHTPSDSESAEEIEKEIVVEDTQSSEKEGEPETTAETVAPVEVEATLGEDAAVETEHPVEKGPAMEAEVAVEKQGTPERVGEETVVPAEVEASLGEDAAVETEPPAEKEPTTEAEATVEERRTPERPAEGEEIAPPATRVAGDNVQTIVVAYPVESVLDCPRCPVHFPGDRLEDLREHLREQHPDSRNAWQFLCALCADRYGQQEDTLSHVLREHMDEVRSLPRDNILQDRDKLLAPVEPHCSPIPSTAGTQEEEEVPPLPPPIFPPLPPDEPPKTPPPPPPPTVPPPREGEEPKRGKKSESANQKEEQARKALAELRDRTTELLLPFVDGELCEEEWRRFCELVQTLPEELKKVLGKFGQKRGNPTRNWRRRQQQKARREGEKKSNDEKVDGKKKGKDDDRRRDDRRNNNRKEDSRKGRDSKKEDDRGGRDEGRRDVRTRDDRRGRDEGRGDVRIRDDRRGRDDSRRGRDEGRREVRTRDDGRESHRMTGRQRKSLRAKELQMSYRRGAKKCVEKILGDAEERRQCGIPPEAIHRQMSKSYSAAGRGPDKPTWIQDPDREATGVLDSPLTVEEVRRQLRRLPAFSAPGPDGVTYAQWKRLDSEGKLLTIIMNVCRKVARVPPSWKTSTTVLAYKNKGDEKDLKNWRPICLQNTIYKIYAATIARRIATWAMDGDVINSAQKGFLPYEGCFEHIFLLRSCLEDARRRKKKIGVAWLDLENAFGSVPTDHLLGSMKELGLTGCTLDIVEDIYTDSTTRVKIGKTQTDVVECRRGVKQGCPLSPILFDLAMEQLVSGLDKGTDYGYDITGGLQVPILAYADDLCLLAESADALQKVLDRTKEFADWAGLKFRPNKCATLMINNRAARHFVEKITFHMGSGELPSMKWEDHYRYLGCEMGRDPRAETKMAGDRYRREAEKIFASQLIDWQKLDAMRRFVRPKLEYILRTMLPNRTWAKQLDDAVRGMAKKAFRLPRRTITSFFYVPWKHGGLGLPNVENDLDVGWASQVYKFFNSKDQKVTVMCARRLKDTIAARRAIPDANIGNIMDFLNSRPEDGEHRKSNDVRSLFSLVRGSFHRLGALLCFLEGDEGNLRLKMGGKLIQGTESRQSSQLLRGRYHQKQLDSLRAAVDQGKSFHSVAKHPSSSEWIGNGKYMSFADYRFAVKGRLNQLPVRTVLKRTKQLRGSIHCRRCGSQPETLAHAINHCRGYMGMIRSRHGEILKRIRKAIPSDLGEVFLEQEIPGDPEKNRPDLVVINRSLKRAIVVDVTIPFEGEEDSLPAARATKENKYSGLKSWLQT